MLSKELENFDYEYVKTIFGDFDINLKQIEKRLDVSIVFRDELLKISGKEKNVAYASKLMKSLLNDAKKNIEINEQSIDYKIELIVDKDDEGLDDIGKDYICTTTRGKYIRPKTVGQAKYVKAIKDKMIVFGVGPAGTGKTYLAMAHAITAFKNGEVNRIIMTRPAIEAGEKLGFLPGDLQSKVDPYLRPLYDALYEIMGAETFMSNMEKGLIEVAPLAYMRGRTLDNAFIVLDEAQNTTKEQMKMFLTRIGFNSKAVITGDVTQKDLPDGKVSGLEMALRVLKNIDEIGISHLSAKDVVRHPVVRKIVKAYDDYDKRQELRKEARKELKKEAKNEAKGDYKRESKKDRMKSQSHTRT